MIIYKATNKKNGKFYIGKTIKDLKVRIYYHERSVKKGSHFVFHRAIRKYGINSFKWEILESFDDENLLNKREIEIIEETQAIKVGYNTSPGGQGGNIIQYLSLAKQKEWRRKCGLASRGRKLSPETKQKISIANKGKKRTLAMRKRISDSKKGEKHPWWGKKMSQEICDKKRQSMIGKNVGKIRSEKFKKQISKKYTGCNNPNYKKLEKSVIDKIVKMFKENKTILSIEKFTGIHRKKIRRTLVEQGFANFQKGKVNKEKS